MDDNQKTILVVLQHPQTRPTSKWEKAAVSALGAFLVWEILTGPSHRRRG